MRWPWPNLSWKAVTSFLLRSQAHRYFVRNWKLRPKNWTKPVYALFWKQSIEKYLGESMSLFLLGKIQILWSREVCRLKPALAEWVKRKKYPSRMINRSYGQSRIWIWFHHLFDLCCENSDWTVISSMLEREKKVGHRSRWRSLIIWKFLAI